MLRVVSLVIAAVFVYGLQQSQPWAHSVWTHIAWERFLIAMCATAIVSLALHRYWFYGIMLVLACSAGVQPVAGLAFVLLGGLNLGWLLFHQKDDRLNLLAGIAIYVWLFSLTASLPINTIWLWGVALAVPIAIGRRFTLPLPQPSVAVALPLVANFLLVLKPEVSADGLSQHFAIAQWVKDHGRFHFDAANQIWSVQPMAGDWALTIANLFGGEYAARLLNFVWLLVLVSFVYRALRCRLDHAPAALITGIFASTPLLQLTSTSMFIENFWAALIVGALLAIEQGDIIVAAALCGASGASKLLGLTPAPILGLFALSKKPRWKVMFASVVIFAGIAVVPYARAFIVTGNPVFHYANAFFKSPLMRSDVSFVDGRYPPRLAWHTLYDVTFHTDLFVESEPGTAGYQWLWFLPLSLVAALRLRPLHAGRGSDEQCVPAPEPQLSGSAFYHTALAAAVFMVILVFSQQASLRYVECAMPLLTIAFAPAAAALVEDRLLHRVATAVGLAILGLNLLQMPGSGGYHRDFAIFPSERAEYLTRLAPARKLVDDMNRRAPAAPVAFLDGDEIAGLRGPSLTSTWHTQKFADKLALVRSVGGYLALMREFHVDYLIAPRESHWRYLDGSALALFLETCTDRLSTSGGLQLVRIRPHASATELPPAPPGTYDDSNAHIVYGGSWYLDSSFAEPAQRTITYSSAAGASIRFAFTGTRLTYYFTRAFNRGLASVEIDGVVKAAVDLNSAVTEWQAHVTFDRLAPGPHTIVVRNAGPKDRFIDLDQFVVE